jgi:hypothetical protein
MGRIPLFYLCSGLGILILNANALCGVTSKHSSALSWLPMAQFTLEVEVARDGITHVRARILMGLLMKCIGKPSSRHFAIAMEVLVRSYGSQEKWAEDISVVALTLFYLIRYVHTPRERMLANNLANTQLECTSLRFH